MRMQCKIKNLHTSSMQALPISVCSISLKHCFNDTNVSICSCLHNHSGVSDDVIAPLIRRCAGTLRELNISCAGPLGDPTLTCVASHCAARLRMLDVCYAPNVTLAGESTKLHTLTVCNVSLVPYGSAEHGRPGTVIRRWWLWCIWAVVLTDVVWISPCGRLARWDTPLPTVTVALRCA